MGSSRFERLTLDAAVGLGLNQLGDLLAAPPLEWSIEQPSAGVAAVFRGHTTATEPVAVHAVLDRWADCFGLAARHDHGGIRENSGVLITHDAHIPVRLIVWGITDRAEFDA